MKISFCLISLFLVAAAADDPDQLQEEKRNLQGTWKVIAAENKGEEVPA